MEALQEDFEQLKGLMAKVEASLAAQRGGRVEVAARPATGKAGAAGAAVAKEGQDGNAARAAAGDQGASTGAERTADQLDYGEDGSGEVAQEGSSAKGACAAGEGDGCGKEEQGHGCGDGGERGGGDGGKTALRRGTKEGCRHGGGDGGRHGDSKAAAAAAASRGNGRDNSARKRDRRGVWLGDGAHGRTCVDLEAAVKDLRRCHEGRDLNRIEAFSLGRLYELGDLGVHSTEEEDEMHRLKGHARRLLGAGSGPVFKKGWLGRD